MSIWFAIPSVRPIDEAAKVLAMWRQQGYKIALLRQGDPVAADLPIPTDRYLGWARSINRLARAIFAIDPDAEWIVSGGDDCHPDLAHSAEEIGRQCTEHFGGTFGVMQPTGDRWGEGTDGATIDRIAGSPWLGREWCERAYQGTGPLTEAYFHNYADEELQNVAIRAGVFWQRPDLIQHHAHWARKHPQNRPAFAEYINGREYHEARAIFQSRRAQGFPGSEPLAA